jgi:hypothetical protein
MHDRVDGVFKLMALVSKSMVMEKKNQQKSNNGT